jgi:hypothetical protein
MKDETYNTWLLLGVGCFMLLCTVHDIYTGRLLLSWRHRWGFLTYYDLHRDEAPILYWIHILIQILIVTGTLGYAIQCLIEGR